ncbi:hypothetical protein K443DRAFT_646104 [Laccaria amethystina LaAM-08-1]|uniref:Uncharacterized protein n=1 Tax=Laccaria amethystina LaAM-08-1 TaxID=1095629 RepID=A0A0C9XAT4_9AGAR|nr:hypothetical protein K443DRAFT_646104 [Laccaria amethystina LaAM-08-1]
MIFITIFYMLSFLPAVTFLGISLFMVVVSTVTALVFAFLAAATITLMLHKPPTPSYSSNT